MKQERPLLVTYITDLNILNIVLLIVSLFPKLTKRFGIITVSPTISNVIPRVAMILVLLVVTYGLLRLKRWGFWLMLGYNMFFLIISVVSLMKGNYNIPNFIIPILGLSLTYSAKQYFIKEYKTNIL
jgi:hypothetical protein